jgi:hypothetical protein
VANFIIGDMNRFQRSIILYQIEQDIANGIIERAGTQI